MVRILLVVGCALSAVVGAIAGASRDSGHWFTIPMHQHLPTLHPRHRQQGQSKVAAVDSAHDNGTPNAHSASNLTASASTLVHNSTLLAGIDSDQAMTAAESGGSMPGASLYGWPSSAYHVDLFIGTPPQQVRLVVDTGSSNLAVAGPQIAASFPSLSAYDPALSNTSRATGQSFKLDYVVGEIDCEVFHDVISVQNGSTNLMLQAAVSFGVITSQADFFSKDPVSSVGVYDGILGLAYRNLASDGLVPLFQALVQQQHIDNVFAMELCQPSDAWIMAGNPTGFLTLGWAPAESPSTRLYTPLLHEEYYGVEVHAMAVGGTRLPLSCGAYNAPALSIVDSGTTDLLVPHRVFAALIAAISATPGLSSAPNIAKYLDADESTRQRIPPQLFQFFPSLSMFFPLNTTHEFEVRMSPQNYLHNATDRYGRTIGHWLGISPICVSESGITIGMALLTATLVEYNRETQQIGFSNVSHSTCGNQPPAVFGPFAVASGEYRGSCIDTSVHCGPQPDVERERLLYGLGVACGVVGLVLLFYAVLCVRRAPRQGKEKWRIWRRCCCIARSRSRSGSGSPHTDEVEDMDYIRASPSEDDDDTLLEFTPNEYEMGDESPTHSNGDIPLAAY